MAHLLTGCQGLVHDAGKQTTVMVSDTIMVTCRMPCCRHSHNIARHIHDWHAPAGGGPEERTGVFALSIIHRPSDGKFLMTQEYAGW
jgi:hypothetical protein